LDRPLNLTVLACIKFPSGSAWPIPSLYLPDLPQVRKLRTKMISGAIEAAAAPVAKLGGKCHRFAGDFVGNWGKGIPYAHVEALDSRRRNLPPPSAAI
jgi:hypothetical protein